MEILKAFVCRYFVIANAVVSIYGFFVLFLPSQSLLWRLVVVLDLVRNIHYYIYIHKSHGKPVDLIGLSFSELSYTYIINI